MMWGVLGKSVWNPSPRRNSGKEHDGALSLIHLGNGNGNVFHPRDAEMSLFVSGLNKDGLINLVLILQVLHRLFRTLYRPEGGD